MGPRVGRWRALANAGFILAVLGLAGFGVLEVSSRQWRLQKTFTVCSDFTSVGGVGPGDRVRLQGIDAGVVEVVEPPSAPGKPVRLVLRVDEKLRNLVRSDALARIVTEGVVGSKVVEIVPGRADAPPLPSSGVVPSESPLELAEIMKRASASLARLDAVTLAAEQGLGEINAIASTIRKGEGSLGKFVKEDEAYRKLVSLTDRGEHTLHDLEDNLSALKRTWPLSRYFTERAFFDRERVLFHPGSSRDSRMLLGDELFEPGRAVLTNTGRARLDQIGAWFKKVKRPTSEVVIAVFTDTPRDADLAQILTQEQADAVRNYLVAKHSIDSSGWFSSRKVGAVGFGIEAPRAAAGGSQGLPPRRIEVILFTPQA